MNISDKRGWKPLNRIIMESWVWKSEYFDNFHAWADLFLSVNHAEATIPFNDTVITIEENCMLTSESYLAKRWGWSRKKVSNFLKKLNNLNMISYKRIGNGTYLRVHNNAENLYIGNRRRTATEQSWNNHGTTTEPVEHTNNNKENKENKNNNDNKNIYSTQKVNFADNVLLTMEEYCTLIEEFGDDDTVSAIKMLNNYKKAHGKNYADDSAAIRSWVIDAVLKKKKMEEERGTFACVNTQQEEFELLKSEDVDEFEERMMKKSGLIT